jgi:translation initiation factor eIF-2B subunit alpha
MLHRRGLTRCNSQVTLVLDSAAAFMMERVDMVLVGAEGVVESGGIINKLGTFQARHASRGGAAGRPRLTPLAYSALAQIATVAKAFGKAFYVAAESYKFARLFPLNQRDLPVETKSVEFAQTLPDSVNVENPSRDYTPPHLITLLFTDLGVLTPASVSDELIQLYI